MRILVADGDNMFLDILRLCLCNRGHEVKIAADGPNCIAVQRDFVPDLLILAGDLPGGGGGEVLAHMRDDALLSRVPVILIADSRIEFDPLVKPAVIGWLRKPFRLSDLLSPIASLSRQTAFVNGQRRRKQLPANYFRQSCPVCGRTLHVPVQLLGQAAMCQHCRASFVTRDEALGAGRTEPRGNLLRRAEALLAATDHASPLRNARQSHAFHDLT